MLDSLHKRFDKFTFGANLHGTDAGIPLEPPDRLTRDGWEFTFGPPGRLTSVDWEFTFGVP